MTLSVSEALQRIAAGESVSGCTIDFDRIKVEALDVMKLAKAGFVVPEEAIYYDDDDIAYDPDFDEIEWSKEPIKMSWDEKIKLAEKRRLNGDVEEEVSVRIKIADRDIRQWMYRNRDKMGLILADFIVDIYKANKIIQK
ncbi:MAG TPA: hypothetical protein PKH43_02495 [Saprospiraceae bacterium]|nr:hypothetical protein [Saprospiraceae bacterium]